MKIKKGRFKALVALLSGVLIVGTMNVVGFLVIVHNQANMKRDIKEQLTERVSELKFQFNELEYLFREYVGDQE